MVSVRLSCIFVSLSPVHRILNPKLPKGEKTVLRVVFNRAGKKNQYLSRVFLVIFVFLKKGFNTSC